MMPSATSSKELRSFGLLMGAIFAGIGIWPLVVYHSDIRQWALGIALVFGIPAVIYPKSLFWIHKGWMILGHMLGAVNTRVILGVVYFVLVTPIGIVRRWMGKDPMGRNLNAAQSYRIMRQPRAPSHLSRQY